MYPSPAIDNDSLSVQFLFYFLFIQSFFLLHGVRSVMLRACKYIDR